MERNAELFEGLFKRRVYLLWSVGILLGSRVVYYILVVDFGHIQMTPLRLFHPLPFAEGVQAEVEQPLGLLLERRNGTYNVFIQAFRYINLLDIGNETLLILLLRYVLDQLLFFK